MIYYIKLHVPWDVLCFYAEDLLLRAPLQVISAYIFYVLFHYSGNTLLMVATRLEVFCSQVLHYTKGSLS